mmetsp:Transcript_30492/g.55667  ORF Transcript_30492/g.55667 Transcript_30492/m.55667 type:complete len:189 (-) Transcript_30492:88-654(-)
MAPCCSEKRRCRATLALMGMLAVVALFGTPAFLAFPGQASAGTISKAIDGTDAAVRPGRAAGYAESSPVEPAEASSYQRFIMAAAAALLVGLAGVSPAEAARNGKNWLDSNDDTGDYGFSSSLGSKLDDTYNRVKPICKDVEMVVQGGSRLGSDQGMIRVQCQLPDGVEVSKREEDPFAVYSGYGPLP